jgi:hypothetical protein
MSRLESLAFLFWIYLTFQKINIKDDETLGAFSTHGGGEKDVRKPDGKRTLERPRHRWKEYTTIYLKRMECEDVNWIQLSQDSILC